MAGVADLCLPGWDEWRRQMLEKRRRRWRDRVRARVRVSLWAKVYVCIEEEDEEDDGEEEEAEGMSSEEEKVSQDEEKEEGNKAGDKRKEVEEEGKVMREAEDTEDEGENDERRGVKEDEEDDREVIEADGKVDEEEDETEEEKGVVREVNQNDQVEEDEVRKSKDLKEEENDVEDKENGEVEEVEEQDMMEAEETEEEEEEKENEFPREMEEAEELEEGREEGENGAEDDVVSEEDRQVRAREQVEEEDEWEEEHQEQEQTGQYHLAEPFREHMRRSEDKNILQNQGSMRREPKTVNEIENVSDSVESDYEDSDWTGSEDEFYNFDRINNEVRAVGRQYPKELEDTDDKSCRNEKSILEAQTSKESKVEKDESEKLTFEKEMVAESLATQEEELQVHHEKLQKEEEESADEEAEYSTDEEADEEDAVKIYCKDNYCTDVFRTLTEFRDSSLLTDLTLTTEDGRSFHVHSPVLAAVSSFIRESIIRSNKDRYNDGANERNDASVGVHSWSVSLGPEVDHVGLKAVVEFAYTGHIPCLNANTLHQIKAAAQTLGAPRVLDLCKEEEEMSAKTGGQKKEERISAAYQMTISLQSIKQLWVDRVGCDVILEALGGSLHVHRVILAVCSDYFRGMFTLGMKESHQSCVTLPFLLASELEVLIGCSYSGALTLSWKYVFELTSTTLQLQYQPALSLCLDFLHQEINPHSCLDVASFAEAYEMEQLLEVADDFVLRQFQKVACIPKFKDLPAKKLLKYLNSRSLCVSSELVVFKAVVTWIQARPKVRMKLAKDLMETIHFPLMTFKEFKEVQSFLMWSDHSLAVSVFEDFCSNKTQCRIYLPKESLVLIGGEQISEDLCKRSISRELWFGNSLRNHGGVKKAMEWRKLGDMPEAERFNHEVAVLRGQLYVFGGKKYYGINDTLNSVYRYDPLQNSWESLADMQEKRCSFSVVVLDGKIYAIGGHCDPEYLESVERYCPTANSWSFVWPLDLPLAGHIAKVLQGQIFVSGGLSTNNQHLASMFLYHPETGSTYLANMAKPRARHCMETLGGCLYVAGGITTDDNINVVDHLACEVYDPVADSWTAFTSLPVPHVGAGGVVLEGKFYVLGGYSQEDYSDTKIVHRYDPTTQKWENMGKMPGPNNDIRATLLCLPSHFRL